MWILKNTGNPEECFYLTREKSKYTIGRLGADLVLQDSSVSRSHAFLELSDNANELKLSDTASKYGTYYNDGLVSNTRIKSGECIVLHDSDRIRFGVLANVWCVSRMPLVTMISSLPPDQVNTLEKCVEILGGQVLQQWNASCTHLTMSEISTTVKLLNALIEQIPVVTCEYWRDLLLAVREKKNILPMPQQYFPRTSEALMQRKTVDLSTRLDRKRVFADLTFVFMNRKHYEMYASIVQLAGGVCKELKSGIHKSFLLKKNTIVVQYVPSTQSQSSQSFDEITEYIEAKSLRLVPEYEIGLAILECSTAKYCNPSYKMLNDLIPPSMLPEAEKPSEAVCVESTSNLSNDSCNIETEVFVPETVGNSMAVTDETDAVKATLAKKGPTIVHQETEKVGKRKCSVNELFNESENHTDEFEDINENPPKAKKSKDLEESEDKSIDKTTKTTEQHSASKELKTQNVENMPHSTVKPAQIVKRPDVKTYSLAGFLEKSQVPNESIVKSSLACNTNQVACVETITRKRPRIAVITGDDDDNDLFGFISADAAPSKKQKSSNIGRGNADDSDDDYFAFTGSSPKKANTILSDAENEDDNDNVAPTERFVPKKKSNSEYVSLPKPKPLPLKICTDGWLSCSLDNMMIKNEEGENASELSAVKKEDSVSLPQQEWLESLKGSFEVRIAPLHIANVRDTKDLCTSSDLNSSMKNFKSFKKCIYRSQQRVLTTSIS